MGACNSTKKILSSFDLQNTIETASKLLLLYNSYDELNQQQKDQFDEAILDLLKKLKHTP